MGINENPLLDEAKHWISFIMWCDKRDDPLDRDTKIAYTRRAISLLGDYVLSLV